MTGELYVKILLNNDERQRVIDAVKVKDCFAKAGVYDSNDLDTLTQATKVLGRVIDSEYFQRKENKVWKRK